MGLLRMCRLNGETVALAWKQGWNGTAVSGHDMQLFGQWEQIEVTHAVIFKRAPGWVRCTEVRSATAFAWMGWEGWKK